jgi:hypothetical protein
MNFSVQNNSLSRLIVVSQWFFESIGRSPSIDTHFFDPSSPELIHFSGGAHSAPQSCPELNRGGDAGVPPKAEVCGSTAMYPWSMRKSRLPHLSAFHPNDTRSSSCSKPVPITRRGLVAYSCGKLDTAFFAMKVASNGEDFRCAPNGSSPLENQVAQRYSRRRMTYLGALAASHSHGR